MTIIKSNNMVYQCSKLPDNPNYQNNIPIINHIIVHWKFKIAKTPHKHCLNLSINATNIFTFTLQSGK